MVCRCIACNERIDRASDSSTFPLCSLCHSTLLLCPKLCSNCGSPECVQKAEIGHDLNKTCLRPWVQHKDIQSFSSLYLLLNTGFSVLRKWKTSRGPYFDRQVLKPNTGLIQVLRSNNAQAIIPIPQSFHRKWKMRGSPAECIAQWVSSLTHVPLVPALLPPQPPKGGERSNQEKPKRQAELSMLERLQSPLRFRINPKIEVRSIRCVILVDDFMTSGRTLDQAAQVLTRAGIEEIHVFCLGVRIAMKQKEATTRPNYP